MSTSVAENKALSASGDVNASDASVPPELLTRHPLQNRWALWYLKADRNKEWEDCLKMVSLFDTVEDFWSLYNHIQSAGGLNWGSDYYLFKEGIKPMWEDVNNVQGGRWLVVVDKQLQRRTQLLDHYWLELLMAIVGEQFDEYGDYICGAVVNVRQKGDKVSLWTRDATRDDVNLRIGQVLKQKLSIPDTEILRYEVHKDSSARTSSTVKPRICLPAKDPAPVKEKGPAATTSPSNPGTEATGTSPATPTP
ncbi:Eukaryotic translation initiation factor 4E-3 [Caenorhabditis elegans]|uniref:Isoform c of Eukaryotic translation initiation factor 4E-3 n=1 Tax=Caenorhabditis elegans TaxID=6239 RepID=O61955-3|nr:Eukaryotic translation initiation factor 4E-3 [Caenorhabditis elegans]CCD61788.1 Eukaryotic translation initiation factor 4E-3 [Caenorhabditis elegans]|eukprot:NP_741502.1 Eukaryotic translation initiation factor 4E-3 [Caenorhabditis elegans]